MYHVAIEPAGYVNGEWQSRPCGLPADYVAEYEVRDGDEWPSMPFADLCEAHAQVERGEAGDVGLVRLTSLIPEACRV